MAALSALCGTVAAGEPAERFEATKDVWVSSWGSPGHYSPTSKEPPEFDCSMGKTPHMKLKTTEECALIDFDLSRLKGKVVSGGTLFLHEEDKTKLRWMGVSTVSSPWEEGAAAEDYTKDEGGHGATFAEAAYKERPWAYPGSDLTDVTFTSGCTIDHHAELKRLEGGWLAIDLPAHIIQALICGDSYGLCVQDDGLSVQLNSFVHSREAGGDSAPYLTVQVTGSDKRKPRAPRGLEVKPWPERATLDDGALSVSFEAPRDAFCYFIEVDGKPLERWRTPRPLSPGTLENIVIDRLPPGKEVEVTACISDASGNLSDKVTAKGNVSPVLARPKGLPQIDIPLEGRRGTGPVLNDILKVWAAPEMLEVDPLTGHDVHEKESDYRPANSVWNGAAKRVNLSALQGEILAFQVLLAIRVDQTLVAGISVSAGDLVSGENTIPASAFEFYREWYVATFDGFQPEYAVPLEPGQEFSIPWKENGVPGQKVQAVFVDLYVPFDAVPGTYSGTLKVSIGEESSAQLGVELDVLPVALPQTLSFVVELADYVVPDGAGSENWFDLHKIAHQHRCALNILSYSDDGSVEDYVPRVVGRGTWASILDWSHFDEAIGPLLDGSVFEGLHRDKVPVPVLYLPFHENYPSPISLINYYGKKQGTFEEVGAAFYLNAPAVEDLFPKEYWHVVMSVSADYARHFAEKEWNHTEFQCCLRNKIDLADTAVKTSWWRFDQPKHYRDWEMLRAYSSRFLEGVSSLANRPGRPRMVFRGNVSRPHVQRNWLKDRMQVIYTNSHYHHWKRLKLMRREYPLSARVYAHASEVEATGVGNVSACVKAFIYGADGFSPWNSLQGNEALRTPNRNSIVVDARDELGAPVASLRLKALRRGQQDVEYLKLLMERKGYNEEQLRALVLAFLAERGVIKADGPNASVAPDFTEVRSSDYDALRRAITKVLAESREEPARMPE